MERYNNERIIIQSHIRLLIDLPDVTRECAADLRQLIDNSLKHIRALDLLKIPVANWNAILVYIVTNKLDKVTRRDWERSLEKTKIPDLSEL